MYKKILAPVDGSEFAECSLDHVREVAAGCGAKEVIFILVIEPFPPSAGLAEDWRLKLEKDAQADAEAYLAKLVDHLNLKSKKIEVKTIIVHGKPARNILKYASENEVDLIIMATHGRSGLSHWVFGSVAERILRHSHVPVLIVTPPEFRDRRQQSRGEDSG
ncbi:MAG: universal stress protein [Deltaproteobacteria bacterium]|nr:MAG: universal stress protein [Deltaproteobacteria bacterium]